MRQHRFAKHCVTNNRRRGTLTMELILVLPILMILLLGLFEFSLLFAARGEVVTATRSGARLASLHGVTSDSVELEVKRSLPANFAEQVTVDSHMGESSGDEVFVMVRLPMSAASPDLLWPIGFGLTGREIVAQSTMRKE